MIGKIKGIIIELEGNLSLVKTSCGIYYYIFLTPKLINQYKINQAIEIYTHLHVKEDSWTLYGFETKEEYRLFKLMISINGVGPKLAYGIISFSNPKQILKAIEENNLDHFIKIPGLGKKTAMKLILELSQKLKQNLKIENLYLSNEDKTVVEALIALGFKAYQAKKLLSKLPQNLSIEEKISQALKLSSKT